MVTESIMAVVMSTGMPVQPIAPRQNTTGSAVGTIAMRPTLTDRNTRGTYLLDNGHDKPAVILLSYA